MTYKPEHLKEWTTPPSWFGTPWKRWYVFLGQHRDSDTATRSNFIVGLRNLKKLPALETTDHDLGRHSVFKGDYDEPSLEVDTVQVVRESHCMVGWIEWIAIHESDDEALKLADSMAKSLDGYPILDEDHLSELETEEADAYWATMSVGERLHTMQGTSVSKFAARHDWVPHDDSGRIEERLRGY